MTSCSLASLPVTVSRAGGASGVMRSWPKSKLLLPMFSSVAACAAPVSQLAVTEASNFSSTTSAWALFQEDVRGAATGGGCCFAVAAASDDGGPHPQPAGEERER